MIRRFLPLFVCVAAAWADSAAPKGLTVTFNGAALEIHTESTLANSPLSTSGSVAISDRNQVSRTVVDKAGNLLFTYDIDVSYEASSLRYTIRIKPHDPTNIDLSLAALLKERRGNSAKVTPTRRDVPTVSAVREFKNVRIGEAVSIDILVNPSTGERIYDVIQPLAPGPKGMEFGRDVPKLEDEFSLMKPRIAINGKTVENQGNNWMIGGALKIALPGHGTVYLAIQPVTSHAFQPVGRVERGKLTFPIGADFVEITSTENIMKKAAFRTIWVYWDASAPNTETVDITCSGGIESLLPKK